MKKEIKIDALAKIAKLDFNEEEKIELTEDLDRLRVLVGVLDELKEDDGVRLFEGELREDEVEESENRDILMKNAPAEENGFFTVPEIGGHNE